MVIGFWYNNSEGNICNITQTTPIDISVKPVTVEHVHVGQNYSTEETKGYRALFKEFWDVFSWTYKEMIGIDLSIVVHEIKTYPTVRPLRQKLRQVHPRKDAAINAKVEKLLKVGFIYPIPPMECVSNIVPVAKN